MKTIEYAPNEEAIRDADAERPALEFLQLEGQQHICVSTDNFINAARVHICRGVIPHDQVVFLFDGMELRPDSDGRLDHWPRGFCDFTDRWLMELLHGRVKKSAP
jgi:hypothetical protein